MPQGFANNNTPLEILTKKIVGVCCLVGSGKAYEDAIRGHTTTRMQGMPFLRGLVLLPGACFSGGRGLSS